MDKHKLFSRRVGAGADFRPDDPGGMSPFAQLRRLSAYLRSDTAGADEITDCPEALDALREYTYRKIHGGTSHEDYLALPDAHVDWTIAIHEVESANFQSRKPR